MMSISTPLGKDYFLINKLSASEALSDLYSYEVELLHEEEKSGFAPTAVDINSILGQAIIISVEQRDGSKREFTGMVSHFSQGARDVRFSFYYATVVPNVWLLTQMFQSRIFQQKTVPDILKEVFTGFDISWETTADRYEPRNYCVQYRETDFDFASRLMEEEGIFYYFEHKDGKHKMVIADRSQSHRDCPSISSIPFYIDTSKVHDQNKTSINNWQTDYQLQTGRVTLWDHNFQLPDKTLEAYKSSIFSVADNRNMEFYDFPGGYARKFDGISKDGSDQAGELQKIYEDNKRTAEVRMQELDTRFKTASGSSDSSSMIAGYRFTLTEHPNSEVNGKYVITSVTHRVEQNPAYVAEFQNDQPYKNSFVCISHGAGVAPFRPVRKTRKPIIHGTQTAIVVGPAGEEIFTDKFGRVKVQFNWERDRKVDATSSCWIRVAQSWASNRWGSMFIPRIGMEVIVHFLEGDPDQPIITGCVYNPATMPPYTLPEHKTKMTIKSNSSKGGDGFNELRFEDEKGKEHIFMHAEKDQHIRVKANRREWVIGDGKESGDRHLTVGRDKRELVKRDKHTIVKKDFYEKIEGEFHHHVGGEMYEEIDGGINRYVEGDVNEYNKNHYESAANTIYLEGGMNVVIEAGMQLTLKGPGGFVDIGPAGVTIQGNMVLINSGGAPGTAESPMVVLPTDPDEAELPINADPGSDAPTYKNQRAKIPKPKIPSYTNPWHKPDSPKNKDKKHWIEIKLVDEQGNPVGGEQYRITLPDGKTLAEGRLNQKGIAKVSNIDPGNCKITFPNLDDGAWKPK
jgi:type VI secretion system secreted protein VgrG